MSVDDWTGVTWDQEPIDPGLDSQPEIVEWTLTMVLASLGLPVDASRERVLARARDAIDHDELTTVKAEVLVTSGYPELDPDLDDEADVPDEEYKIGPDGVRLI